MSKIDLNSDQDIWHNPGLKQIVTNAIMDIEEFKKQVDALKEDMESRKIQSGISTGSDDDWFDFSGHNLGENTNPYNPYRDYNPTECLDAELDLRPDYINYERVKEYLQKGADPFYTDNKGYTFGERAGIKGRLDIVDLIERSKYMEDI